MPFIGTTIHISSHSRPRSQDVEYMWNDGSTTAICDTADDSLTGPQRHVLRLLSSGMSDEAIARASGMSVRTVRRHVTAILEQLGASSRFAAGAMASRRGWI